MMASFDVVWKKSAERELRKLDSRHIPRIIRAVEELAGNPYSSASRKMLGTEREFRIRVGDFLIIYQVNPDEKLIQIFHVRRRKKAYRGYML
jgi:mRNA interferase RelE/StbE